jgi:hypothetical protein
MKKLEINLFELIGSDAAVSSEDGEILYKKIIKIFENNTIVVLNFHNIKLITTAFLNSAIGQLYNKYDSTYLNNNMEIKNISEDDLEKIKKVIARAKEYFKNKSNIEKNINEVFMDEDE